MTQASGSLFVRSAPACLAASQFSLAEQPAPAASFSTLSASVPASWGHTKWKPSTLSTVTLGAIIHTTESEVHPVILVFNKDSRSINVKALRKSSLLEVWVLGLRINLGIAQWRAIALPLVSLDRVVQDSSETRPQKRLTPFSRELFKASAQLFVSHLSYSSHCIASVLVPDHEP